LSAEASDGLTDRDCVLLKWLAEHGGLTSFQFAQALFPSLDYAQERLHKLVGLRVLERFRPNRFGGGSFPYHYVLGQLGLEVVSAQRGEHLQRGYRDRARRRRWQLTNRANLPHMVGVNGFFTALAGQARTHPGCELARWWSARQCQQMGAFATDDADVAERIYTPKSRPDGHGLWVQAGSRVSFFPEYDTGTERPISRLVDKIDGYEDLARVVRQALHPRAEFMTFDFRAKSGVNIDDQVVRECVRFAGSGIGEVLAVGRKNGDGPNGEQKAWVSANSAERVTHEVPLDPDAGDVAESRLLDVLAALPPDNPW
jgi:hypothetical protein